MSTEQIVEEFVAPRRVEPVRAEIAAMRAKVTELERQARALIRERPVVAVLAAAGLGYVLARAVARGRR